MDKQLDGQIVAFLTAHREEMIADLFTLARIPSVRGEAADGRPYGAACAQALDAALALCEKHGMETENFDYYCGTATWAPQGAGKSELGFVAHLDVVPAGDGWSGKPFEPFLRDGFAIGRGVRDNKNGAIAGLYAVRCIQSLGVPMRHTLRLILGSAEETGMDDLPHFLEKRPAPAFSLVPDTAFPVCHGEKGIYSADFLLPVGEELTEFSGGMAHNVVPDRAAATVDGRRFEASGISSHASRPDGSVNAVRELARALLVQGGIRLSEKTRAALSFIDRMLADNHGQAFGIAARDEVSGRLSCICGMARLEDGHIRMNLNIRYPVTHDGAQITAGFERCAKESGMTFVFDDDDKPSFVPADHPAIARLTRVYAEVTGDALPPYVMGGGTYARHLPNAVAFGPDFPGEEAPCAPGHGDCHQPDECQSVHGLIEAVRIYVHALLELDKAVD